MAEARARLSQLPDDLLEAALREFGRELHVPSADDLPARVTARIADLPAPVTARIADLPAPAREPWWRRLGLPARPARRALILALALIIALAAIAGAVGLGLPGIRIELGPRSTSSPIGSASASASATPTFAPSGGSPGAASGLGTPTSPTEAATTLGRPLPVVSAPYGPPDATYVDPTGRHVVNLVWGPGPGRPEPTTDGVSLLLTVVPADIKVDLMKKIADGARIEDASVSGKIAYWISGAHELYLLGPNGEVIDVRVAGDVLLWSDGGLTYRLESKLGKQRSVELAESINAS